jgi:hypothetical protein
LELKKGHNFEKFLGLSALLKWLSFMTGAGIWEIVLNLLGNLPTKLK